MSEWTKARYLRKVKSSISLIIKSFNSIKWKCSFYCSKKAAQRDLRFYVQRLFWTILSNYHAVWSMRNQNITKESKNFDSFTCFLYNIQFYRFYRFYRWSFTGKFGKGPLPVITGKFTGNGMSTNYSSQSWC